jgi:hypothetical protein
MAALFPLDGPNQFGAMAGVGAPSPICREVSHRLQSAETGHSCILTARRGIVIPFLRKSLAHPGGVL